MLKPDGLPSPRAHVRSAPLPPAGFLLAAKDLGRAFEHEGCRVLAERLRAAAILWWLILLMVLK